ncbi:MAG: DUF3179 domain-containing protein [Chloroflexi bacterium]|nr:DUF3179 domain-containing protein [Chloroflexota bacterium]
MVRITLLVGILLAALLSVRVAQAQLSCETPALDAALVRSLQRTWDKTDFCLFEEGVFDEILSGGVGRDGIPPIDNPVFEPVDTAQDWLQAQSPVIILEIEGAARAYPLEILIWHEIVNDVLSDIPVAVTYCPLCNSAIVYDRRVGTAALRFGVSGMLRNSDLIMWDDLTQSWWQQLTGEGIVGAYTGTQLTLVPSLLGSFGVFAQQYPQGEVLTRDTGFSRSYGTNPYDFYDSNENPFLFRGDPDPRLPAVERVLAGMIGGVAVAYPFTTLETLRVINDTVGSIPVVALWQAGATSAIDGPDINAARDVGMAALYRRTVDERVLTFVYGEDGAIRDEQTGSLWNIFGTALEGELAGAQLQQEFAFPHLWFAWAAFRPDTLVYGVAG